MALTGRKLLDRKKKDEDLACRTVLPHRLDAVKVLLDTDKWLRNKG